MTVALTEPNPDPPNAGRDFTINITGGTPPFTVGWKIGSGLMNRVDLEEPPLEIFIPRGTAGEILAISVKDDNGDIDLWSGLIT
jgi:hypothetical protein